MNESEWRSCTDPQPMLDFLRSSGLMNERKVRLFVCASTRLLWEHIQPGPMREAVEAGERRADGVPWEDECRGLISELTRMPVEYGRRTGRNWFAGQMRETLAAYFGARKAVGHWFALAEVPHRHMWHIHSEVTGPQQPGLLRDIFGGPFRPVTLDPSLLTPAIVKLARAAYDERLLPSSELDAQRLAVLADALEEAGLTDAGLLAHLREPGGHVRGCWGVDLLLGKG